MRILYLLTTPPPVVPGTDAVAQEVDLLRTRFGGEIVWLRPSWWDHRRYPRPLLGLHRLREIRQGDRRADLVHVYAPQLQALPLLRFVRRPVVYTVTAAVDLGRGVPPTPFLRQLGAIVVPSRNDLDALAGRGLSNARLIRSGIDVTRFTDTPAPPGPEFILLAGSAPWTRDQFRTKGVDVLLDLARRMRELRLVFLWRGVRLRDLVARVRAHGLSEQVDIIADWVDVSRLLTRVHAAVVLAAGPGLVKAYPHSLLEALAAGRPVIVSDINPMAAYVRETGCGRVVPRLGWTDLVVAIEELRRDYETYRARAVEVGKRDFSQEALVTAYRDVYQAVASGHAGEVS